MSLVSRYLEAHGLPTVLVGSARDVVEHCGVARFYFNDFPLGNPGGHPWDRAMQREIAASALKLLETATGPRTTVVSPFPWKEDPGWRERYGRVDPAEAARLKALGDERRQRQAEAKKLKAS